MGSQVAVSAFAQGLSWQKGLRLLDTLPSNSITVNSGIGSCGGLWQEALFLLCMDDLPARAASYTLAISACRRTGRWEVAICLLNRMQTATLTPSAVTATAAIACCEASREWQQALSILNMMFRSTLEVDAVALRSTIASCGDGNWQQCLSIFQESWKAQIFDEQIHMAVLWSMEAAGNWQMALTLLHELEERRLSDEASYLSAIGSCGKSSVIGVGVDLLWSFDQSQVKIGLSTLLRAMAALFISDPDVIQSALKEALVRLRSNKNRPKELVTLWSSCAVLGAKNAAFSDTSLVQVVPSLQSFDWDELVELSWGAAAAGMASEFFDPLQEEMLHRFSTAAPPDCQSILGLISSCHAAGLLHKRVLLAASRLLEKQGENLDLRPLLQRAAEQVPARPFMLE